MTSSANRDVFNSSVIAAVTADSKKNTKEQSSINVTSTVSVVVGQTVDGSSGQRQHMGDASTFRVGVNSPSRAELASAKAEKWTRSLNIAEKAPGRKRAKPAKATNKNVAAIKVKATEFGVVLVITLCGLAIIAVIGITCAASVNMYKALGRSVDESITSTSLDASAHVDADAAGIDSFSIYLGDVTRIALATPRDVTPEEEASYVVGTISDGTENGTLDVLSNDGSVPDAPAQVIYRIDGATADDIEYIKEAYFRRTGGLGPTMSAILAAWSSSIFQTYCIMDNGFAVLYPFFPLGGVFVDFDTFDYIQATAPDRNPENKTVWSVPYVDAITGEWVVTFTHPVFGKALGDENDRYIGLCGSDIFISEMISYADEASNHMRWGAHLMLAAQDGTIIAIPDTGSDDWGVPSEYSGFSDMTHSSPTYVPSEWNILTCERYADVAETCNMALRQAVIGTPITKSSNLPGGKRLTSCSVVAETGWFAIAVVDEELATKSQRRSLILVIVTVGVLGVMLVAAVTVFGVYVAARRQQSKMSRKIHDLGNELDRANKLVELERAKNADYMGSALTDALTGNMRDAVETLMTLGETATPAQKRILREIRMMLVHRNTDMLRVRGNISDDQRQFADMCGMRIQETDDTCSVMSDGTHLGDQVESNEDDEHRPTALIPDDGVLFAITHAPCFGDDFTLESCGTGWNFDVFDAAERVGKSRVLTRVAMTLLNLHKLVGVESELDASSFLVDKQRMRSYIEYIEDTYCGSVHDRIDCVPSAAMATVTGGVGVFLQAPNQLTMGTSFRPPTHPDLQSPSTPKGQAYNTYHNNIHAADVTQGVCSLLAMAIESSPSLREVITQNDILALIIAAVVHDYGHPGRNWTYLKNTLADAHVFFAGDSPLERMHIGRAMKLLLRGSDNMAGLMPMSEWEREEVFTEAARLVLATDMAKHSEIIGSFSGWSALRKASQSTKIDKNGKILVLQMILKTADISNAFREWPVCKRWTELLAEEFSCQGTDERRLGFAPSKFMDGSISPAEMQKTFVPMIVLPLLSLMEVEFPSMTILTENAKKNLGHWECLASM